MLVRVIKWVNSIALKEKQGFSFWFLNRRKEPYKWTDEVPKDDQEFQDLLKAEEEEAAAYPNISAKLPGVELASEEDNHGMITEEPAADFHNLPAAVLDNAGIDTVAWLRATRDLADVAAAAPHNSTAAVVEVNKEEIIYKNTFDLPDAGLEPDIIPQNIQPIHQRIQTKLTQWRMSQGNLSPITLDHKLPGWAFYSWERCKPTGVYWIGGKAIHGND